MDHLTTRELFELMSDAVDKFDIEGASFYMDEIKRRKVAEIALESEEE